MPAPAAEESERGALALATVDCEDGGIFPWRKQKLEEKEYAER